ncbi:bacteriohemerythrin [Dongshaea marina]|uniref:bacteriohemerythrin n=1 Tax=Dongshaea marina TaxID=2047966 RepID=UPI00131F3CEE|nr:bacteriohemerythrin [Dongshaea marina]
MTLNIPIIDRQHHQLFMLIDQLSKMRPSGSSKRNIGKILDELIEYSDYHFCTEESLLRDNEYPLTEDHLSEHALYIATIGHFKKEFDRTYERDLDSLSEITIKIHRYLLTWWSEHIAQKDSQYVDYIKAIDIGEQ